MRGVIECHFIFLTFRGMTPPTYSSLGFTIPPCIQHYLLHSHKLLVVAKDKTIHQRRTSKKVNLLWHCYVTVNTIVASLTVTDVYCMHMTPSVKLTPDHFATFCSVKAPTSTSLCSLEAKSPESNSLLRVDADGPSRPTAEVQYPHLQSYQKMTMLMEVGVQYQACTSIENSCGVVPPSSRPRFRKSLFD